MLNLPKQTETKKVIPKKAIFSKFNFNTAQQEKFDNDIKQITIVNEVTANTISIAPGKDINGFYLLRVVLKTENFDDKNIMVLSKLINQNIVFLLEYQDKCQIVVYHSKLIKTEWQCIADLTLNLEGLNFDDVWKNIVKSLECREWSDELSLDENIELHKKQDEIQKQIASLEKKMRTEKQPKKKYEIAKKIKKLNDKLEIC